VLDSADAQTAVRVLATADMVVSLSPFSANVEHADVLLPIAPFTETAGSFVNAEGRVQSFHGVVKPLGDARPGWKVLRVLGNLLGLEGFSQESVEEVRAEALGDVTAIASRLSNAGAMPGGGVLVSNGSGLQRLADVPIYSADAIVRRAASLQHTADARAPQATLAGDLWRSLGLKSGDRVVVSQGTGKVTLEARLDETLAAGTVRVPMAHASTAALGAAFAGLTVERA
jgi:NADH-quinone oxidoreductase subunit G